MDSSSELETVFIGSTCVTMELHRDGRGHISIRFAPIRFVAVPGVIRLTVTSLMRRVAGCFVFGALCAFVSTVQAQSIIGDLEVQVEAPEDVPRFVALGASLWSVTQDQSQLFRVTVSNRSAESATSAVEVAIRSALLPGLSQVEIEIVPPCDATATGMPDRPIRWVTGPLSPSGRRHCDLRFRARANATPGLNGFRAAASIDGAEGGPVVFFVQSPADLVRADLALTVLNNASLSVPGTVQRIAFDVRNLGPDAHAPFSVAIGSYQLALTDQTPTPDPFRMVGTTDAACRFDVTTLGAGDPVFAYASVGLPTIPPGESRRCEVLVEILPSASGRSRSLPVILTHFGVGVVEADRLNNIGALQFTFTAEPVPTGSDRWLLPLAVLVLLAGLGFIRAQRRVA